MIFKELIVSVEFLQIAVILLFIMSVIQGVIAKYYKDKIVNLEFENNLLESHILKNNIFGGQE